MTPDQPSPYGPPPGQPGPASPPPGYAAPGYGAPTYGLPGYGAPGYGYGAPGYGAPGYGPAPWGPPGPGWPQPPRRPGIVTASAVLGIVTGGLTALGCLVFLISTLTGDGDAPTTLLLVLGIPCAVGTILGGIRLLGGHRRGILLGAALASVAVLLLALVVGIAVLASGDVAGLAVWVVLALPLPIVTAALTGQRTVKGWSEGEAPRLS